MNTEQLLITAIRCAVEGTALPDDFRSSEEELEKLYTLADRHDQAHLVAYAMLKAGRLSDTPVGKKLQQAYDTALFRFKKQELAMKKICAAFENEGIRYILFKGGDIRYLYPKPWMRVSADIDILLDKANIPRAAEILKNETSAARVRAMEHHSSYVLPDRVMCELHFALLDEDNQLLPEAAALFADPWKYAEPAGGCRMKLTPAAAYCYHIVHMAKHFKQGGCGIKAVSDLLFIQRDTSMLAAAGLEKFERGIRELFLSWFRPEEPSAPPEGLAEYILDGGMFGTLEQGVSIATNGGKENLRYFFRRLIRPRSYIIMIYPQAADHLWLMPWYRLRRFFRMFTGRSNARSKLRLLLRSEKVRTDTVSLSEKLGL